MAKSKLVKANEKIAEGVVDGYKKIENGVVGGYKKIETGVVEGFTKMENAVVGAYKKVEDSFVDQFLTKEGESVEEAKGPPGLGADHAGRTAEGARGRPRTEAPRKRQRRSVSHRILCFHKENKRDRERRVLYGRFAIGDQGQTGKRL